MALNKIDIRQLRRNVEFEALIESNETSDKTVSFFSSTYSFPYKFFSEAFEWKKVVLMCKMPCLSHTVHSHELLCFVYSQNFIFAVDPEMK